jgi:hypothetical protein
MPEAWQSLTTLQTVSHDGWRAIGRSHFAQKRFDLIGVSAMFGTL